MKVNILSHLFLSRRKKPSQKQKGYGYAYAGIRQVKGWPRKASVRKVYKVPHLSQKGPVVKISQGATTHHTHKDANKGVFWPNGVKKSNS